METIGGKCIAALRAAGLNNVLYVIGEDTYKARNASYWSLTAQLKPYAIVQPRNTAEVSKAVKVLLGIPGCKFAVRSGGHMAWAGANNINNGITIDLGLMADTTYNYQTQIASLEPGGTWARVYKELENHGRMVAGGREGKVGIGGLLLGGGISFYTCRVGFACDQVVNYEVVLADGSIINANDQANADLFRALKGGGNNFGIVTRFDIVTFPSNNIWDGIVTCSKESTEEISEALVDFVKIISDHADSHILAMWTYLPQTRDHCINLMLTGLDEPPKIRSLSKFTQIPGYGDLKPTTVATKMESFIVPSGREDAWFTLTFKSDLRIILKAAEIFEATVEKVKKQIPDHNFYFSMVLQPLPLSFGQHSIARGGNMLGLDHIKDDCILLVWAIEVETPEISAAVGFPALKSAISDIEAYASSVGGDVGFRFLNYCDGSQEPLKSYGEEKQSARRF
ncbi:hypothetical protein BDV59DRAFT_211229 [Aspergillus ambiguus]|uniref:FAD-binding oxidoreductase n=1 Tax=Aspergillus ambiguus TaxID=176160 RepID=UPI003CCCB4E8